MSFFENGKKTRREFIRDVALAGTAAAIVPSLVARPTYAAQRQFDHCFKKLIYKKPSGNVGPGSADYLVHLNGSDMDGCDTNFSFGYYSKTGSWTSRGSGPLIHPYDTVMMFVGLNPNVPDYLGAEIEISLGEENEKHTFNSPTVVCVPRNIPYGPIVTKRVEKPFANYTVGLSAQYRTTTFKVPYQIREDAPKDQPTKYGHLVKKLDLPHEKPKPSERRAGFSGNADTIVWPRGDMLEGFEINCSWGFYSGLGPWHTKEMDPHIHVGDEFLVFVGLNAAKPQYLGSQIDYYNGKDERVGKKQEMVAFDVPMCVVCPAGMEHAPLVTKKVDDTYAFFLIRRDFGKRANPNKTSDGFPIM